MAATYSLTGFTRSVRGMQRVPGKHGPDVANKAVGKIAIGAKGVQGIVQRTMKASSEQIREDMLTHVTSIGSRGGSKSVPRIILLASKSLIKQGVRPYSSAADRNRKGKFGRSTAAKLWRDLVKMECKRILAARVRSRGFIVAGWLHGLDDLKSKAPSAVGATTSAGAAKFENGEASKSYAMAARLSSLSAGLYNTAKGADKVSTDAIIQASINAATADNMEYLRQKFGRAISDCIAEGLI